MARKIANVQGDLLKEVGIVTAEPMKVTWIRVHEHLYSFALLYLLYRQIRKKVYLKLVCNCNVHAEQS